MDIEAVSRIDPSQCTPDEVQALKEFALEQKAQYEAALSELQRAAETISSLQRRLFAPRREKNSVGPDQLSLFAGQPPVPQDPEPEEPLCDVPAGPRRKRRRKKKGEGTARFPSDLPRVDIYHDLPEDERVCPQCGSTMTPIGTRERERVRLIPARVEIERHHFPVYGCEQCSKNGTEASIVRAPAPPGVVPGSFATAEAVAYLATEKFLMASPLYRIEQRLALDGIPLSRQTMANWLMRANELWLVPLLDRMQEHLVSYDVAHADETPLQVLHEEGKAPTSKSYVWLYATGNGAPHPIILYDYQPDRRGIRPREFLEGFQGFLQTDGYDGYNNISGATGVACAAHMRRKFWDAAQCLPESARASSLPMHAVRIFDQLFALEEQFAELSPAARKAAREEKARPLLDELEDWLKLQNGGKSKFGTAVNYCLGELPRLRHYLDDGRVALSNNYAERCIKPFTIGRKNWLFSNTPRGAKASAAFYSVIATAKANGCDPYRYLVWLFTQMPNHPGLSGEALDQFMPWNAPDEARSRASEIDT